jgi:1-acyl-sn-glycerol-3-phosphate acyltransferase
MKLLYRIYQLCIAAPLMLVATILTSIITCIGSLIGGAHIWGYYPGKWWSVFICRILLLPVHVTGRENLDRTTSYIFVINHQSAMDIFLIYGFIHRNFKWMMKKELRKIPFVGIACEKARHIFVDRSSPAKVKETIDAARKTLQGGTSLVVFPEGSRTFTGHLRPFKKGAYLLAEELQLPIVPVTLNGPFDVLPRTRGINFVDRCAMNMIIHKPIFPQGEGRTDIKLLMQESYSIIMSDLSPKYRDDIPQ